MKLDIAFQHAEHATAQWGCSCMLLLLAAVSCQIAHIELTLGHAEKIHGSLAGGDFKYVAGGLH